MLDTLEGTRRVIINKCPHGCKKGRGSCVKCTGSYALARRLVEGARTRARKRGLQFDLKVADVREMLLSTNGICPVLGIRLSVGTKKSHKGSPTLDRKNNSKGYTRKNCAIISLKANIIKSNATLEEIRKVAEYLSKETN